MEKLELNLYGVTQISSFGSTGVYIEEFGTSNLYEELDVNDLNKILEYLDENEYNYQLSFPYKNNDEYEDMPEDEWVITLL
jgi:hypothetical protein